MPGRRVSKLVAALLFVAAVAQMSAAANGAPTERRLSDSTRQILKDNELKKLAGRDPAAAIESLDALRQREGSEAVATAIAEVALSGAAKATPEEAKGLFLQAATETYSRALEKAANGGSSLALHTDALEGLIDVLQRADSRALRGETDEIAGPLGTYSLTWVDAGEIWTPATHDFRSARAQSAKKKERGLGARAGIGVPLVAVRREGESERAEPESGVFEIYRYYFALTAVLELEDSTGEGPRRAVLHLFDPTVSEITEFGGVEYPLAIDLGAQLATVRRESDAIFAKGGVLHRGRYLSLTSLYLLHPLQPGKIPLVLTHGLSATPTTWSEAVTDLLRDPRIRDGYQLWFFAYPTNLSFPYSAMLLRRSLAETMGRLDGLGRHPDHDRAVLVGHSMGGLLSRLQITDSGDAFWDALFSMPPEEIDITPDDLEILKRTLFFDRLPFVERAVFFSTPHRGSKHAAHALGKLGASVVRVPKDLAAFGQRIVSSVGDSMSEGAAELGKIPDSVQALQPENPILSTLDGLPIHPEVTYHSVIGDRGKGNTPNSTDGAVPYWSSHLEGAASEKIVPSGHSSHKHPEGIAELERILLLHLDLEQATAASRAPRSTHRAPR